MVMRGLSWHQEIVRGSYVVMAGRYCQGHLMDSSSMLAVRLELLQFLETSLSQASYFSSCSHIQSILQSSCMLSSIVAYLLHS